MLNRINESHSLAEAIMLKIDNKNVSDKTLKKLADKLVSIKNHYGRNQEKHALHMLDTASSLQKIKNQRVYEKINNLIGHHTKENAYEYAVALNRSGIQANDVSNVYDGFMLTTLCQMENKKYDTTIADFACVDSLLSHIENKKDIQLNAITKMARRQEENEGHYTCIDVRKEKGVIKMVVYEPAFVHGDPAVGPDHGLVSLRQCIQERIDEGKIKEKNIQIGVVEMGVQKSPSDCAMFSLFTATKLARAYDVSKNIFSHLKHSGTFFTRMYEKTGKNTIIDPRNKKIEVQLPATFLKHSTSKTAISRDSVGAQIVNKKGQTLKERVVKNYVKRDGINYSNSIEVKRIKYLARIANLKTS